MNGYYHGVYRCQGSPISQDAIDQLILELNAGVTHIEKAIEDAQASFDASLEATEIAKGNAEAAANNAARSAEEANDAKTEIERVGEDVLAARTDARAAAAEAAAGVSRAADSADAAAASAQSAANSASLAHTEATNAENYAADARAVVEQVEASASAAAASAASAAETAEMLDNVALETTAQDVRDAVIDHAVLTEEMFRLMFELIPGDEAGQMIYEDLVEMNSNLALLVRELKGREEA